MLFTNVIVASAVIVLAPSCLAEHYFPLILQQKYLLAHSDSQYDLVLRKLGVSDDMRAKYEQDDISLQFLPTDTSDVFTFYEIGFLWFEGTSLQPGNEFRRVLFDGRNIDDLFTLQGNVLTETQNLTGSPTLTIQRIFFPDKVYEIFEIAADLEGDIILSLRTFVPDNFTETTTTLRY